MFFTYRNAIGQAFISASNRGRPFIEDSPFGQVLSCTLKILSRWLERKVTIPAIHHRLRGEKRTREENEGSCNTSPERSTKVEEQEHSDGEEKDGRQEEHEISVDERDSPGSILKVHELPVHLNALKDMENVQSITFELCGNEEPHLVYYDFEIDLKPLFYTSPFGDITPIVYAPPELPLDASIESGSTQAEEEDLRPSTMTASTEEAEALLQQNGRIVPFQDNTQLSLTCRTLQEWAYQKNESYRRAFGKNQGYCYNNFITEGWVNSFPSVLNS